MSPRPMRVTLVCPRFAPYIGGVERHVEQLALHLAQAGARVEVLTQATKDVVADAGQLEYRDGYLVRRFTLPHPSAGDLVAPGLGRALADVEADVVHAHNYHALPAALAAARTRNRRFVLTPHYHGVGSTAVASALHRVYRPLVGRRVMARADALIAVSPSEKSLLAQHFGPRVAARTTVVPNGARAITKHLRDAERPETIVLTIGRLEPHKRVDLLIRALTLLPRDVRLVAVGHGSQRAALSALATKLNMDDRVALPGQVSDSELDEWMRRATVFVTASQVEAFGLTLADALASGLPAVASDIPAHRDVTAMAFGASTPRGVALVPNTAAPLVFATAIKTVLAHAHLPAPENALPDWAEVAEKTMQFYTDRKAATFTEIGSRTRAVAADRGRT